MSRWRPRSMCLVTRVGRQGHGESPIWEVITTNGYCGRGLAVVCRARRLQLRPKEPNDHDQSPRRPMRALKTGNYGARSQRARYGCAATVAIVLAFASSSFAQTAPHEGRVVVGRPVERSERTPQHVHRTRESENPSTPPLRTAPFPEGWYGYQTLIVDIVSLSLFVGLAPESWALVGAVGYLAGAPIVHASHYQHANALVSLGMRVGASTLTTAGLVGWVSAVEVDQKGTGWLWLSIVGGVSVIVVSIVDAAVVARVAREEVEAPRGGSLGDLAIAPYVAPERRLPIELPGAPGGTERGPGIRAGVTLRGIL